MANHKQTAARTILFDANSLMVQRTGVGHYTAGLVESLAQASPQTQFIGYYYNFLGRKQPPSSPMAANIGYRPIYHAPGPLVNLLRRFGIQVPVELLALKRADFILYPNFLSQPSIFNTPSAPVVHDLMYFDHPGWGSDKNVRDLQRFVPATVSRSSFVIAVSEFTAKRLHEAYDVPNDRILVSFIPPVAAATVTDEEAEASVAMLGLDKPYMLFVGTLEPRKNLTTLMNAYTKLPAELRAKYSLVFAGKTDWKYQDTKNTIEALQQKGFDIRHVGYVDNDTRAALYQRARLMVLASHYEGFGMQILEALQYGVPGAVSDIPVLREVGRDRVSYFDQNDTEDIARVLGDCLLQSRPDVTAMRSYVEQQPDWHNVAERVLTRIDETLSRKGKS